MDSKCSPPDSPSPSNTLKMGTGSDHNLPCAVATTTDPTMFALRSRHPGGVNASLCDGSTRFISETIDLNTYRAISTTQGSEIVDDF